MLTLKIITYNIDGLPSQLDLSALPWVLRPISWIYRLIKGTTLVNINDNQNKLEDTKKINQFILDEDPDIIAVQEDFNYHNELIKNFYDRYHGGEYLGGFDLANLFNSAKLFPYPRFKSDGLNIFAKTNFISLVRERIINWNKSNGYISHANDLLTHKGFRWQCLHIDNRYYIDVFNVHMDADFYDPNNCPNVTKDVKARRSQFKQLYEFIKTAWVGLSLNPMIILGDTNSYDKYVWDEQNVKEFIDNINSIDALHIEECKPSNYNDCDRLFIINNDHSKYSLSLEDIYFKTDVSYSDHKPLIANINIIDK